MRRPEEALGQQLIRDRTSRNFLLDDLVCAWVFFFVCVRACVYVYVFIVVTFDIVLGRYECNFILFLFELTPALYNIVRFFPYYSHKRYIFTCLCFYPYVYRAILYRFALFSHPYTTLHTTRSNLISSCTVYRSLAKFPVFPYVYKSAGI